MSDVKGQATAPPSTPHPSQADEALRQSRTTDAGMSAADKLAHELASYVRPLPTETGARRRAMNVRGW